MGRQYLSAGFMVNPRLQSLNQGPIPPHIHRLDPLADSQNRLMQAEGVLKQQLVHGRTLGVWFPTLWNRIFAISLRIDVKPAARQQNPLHPCKQSRYLFLPLAQWNDNRRGP
jgi:hypothetical protein